MNKRIIISVVLILTAVVLFSAGCVSAPASENAGVTPTIPASSSDIRPGEAVSMPAGVYSVDGATMTVYSDGSYDYADKEGNVVHYNAAGQLEIKGEDGTSYSGNQNSGTYRDSDGSVTTWKVNADGTFTYDIVYADGSTDSYTMPYGPANY